MATKNYKVEGMTCGHCELSVQEEIAEIAGVTAVKADHVSGAVTVEGDGFDDAAIASAVKEVGYTLV